MPALHLRKFMDSLLLVDFENVHRLDTSGLDAAYRIVVFVGASQRPPTLGREPARRPSRPEIQFQSIQGFGKNALDFHIAFHLGRVFETARGTSCYVLSRDKGFDPLIRHLNGSGLSCRRIESVYELEPVVRACARCGNKALLDHNGGLWCALCGAFVVDPDPAHTAHILPRVSDGAARMRHSSALVCAYCNQQEDMGDGIYDDGEWMCGGCVAGYAREYSA